MLNPPSLAKVAQIMKLILIAKQMMRWCLEPSHIHHPPWQITLQSMSQRQLADLSIPPENLNPQTLSAGETAR
jgi:hypothetical protein